MMREYTSKVRASSHLQLRDLNVRACNKNMDAHFEGGVSQ